MSAVNRVQEHVDHRESEFAGSMQACRDAVAEYPLSSVLTIFGLGFGVGAVIGSIIAGPEPTPHSAAAVGRRVLDSIQDYLPTSLRS